MCIILFFPRVNDSSRIVLLETYEHVKAFVDLLMITIKDSVVYKVSVDV